ncbi:hypothetical protein HK101_006662 [Irineochytrium annulatum]|nr:hypothetical protein HK101_006662 [Irineochytrium annulatum]
MPGPNSSAPPGAGDENFADPEASASLWARITNPELKLALNGPVEYDDLYMYIFNCFACTTPYIPNYSYRKRYAAAAEIWEIMMGNASSSFPLESAILENLAFAQKDMMQMTKYIQTCWKIITTPSTAADTAKLYIDEVQKVALEMDIALSYDEDSSFRIKFSALRDKVLDNEDLILDTSINSSLPAVRLYDLECAENS